MRRVAVGLLVLSASIAAVASSDEDEPTRVDNGATSANESESTNGEGGGGEGAEVPTTENFVVGEAVQLGDAVLVVHEFNPDLGPAQFSTPADGMKYVAVDIELTNESDESKSFSSFLQMEVQDQDNRAYNPEFFTDHDLPSLDGEAPPGGSRRGSVVFEVPVDATELRLNFSGDLFSRGTASIQLQ